MPQYQYLCKNCNKAFSMIMTLAEYLKGKVACPKCKSKKVEQQVASFFTVTSKKS